MFRALRLASSMAARRIGGDLPDEHVEDAGEPAFRPQRLIPLLTRRRHNRLVQLPIVQALFPQEPRMRLVILLTAFCFVLELTVANAAGVKNFDTPAGGMGPAIRLLVWTPCAETPREMDARGAIFLAVPGCAVTGEKLPLIVISHGRRG